MRLLADVNVGPTAGRGDNFHRHHGRGDRFGPSPGDDRPGEPDAVDDPVAVAHLDLSAPVELLPPDQPSFRWMHDPSLADAVRDSLRVDAVTAGPRGLAVGWSVPSPRPPVGLAFDVLVEDRIGPVWVAAFATPAGPAAWLAYLRPSTVGLRPPGDRVDVTFRPDPAAAVNTVDVTDVWDAPVVVHDVPIEAGPATPDR